MHGNLVKYPEFLRIHKKGNDRTDYASNGTQYPDFLQPLKRTVTRSCIEWYYSNSLYLEKNPEIICIIVLLLS